jgi:hypothetical protein
MRENRFGDKLIANEVINNDLATFRKTNQLMK